MAIWLKSSDYCGDMKLSICGYFEDPKFTSAEGFELISCLSESVSVYRYWSNSKSKAISYNVMHWLTKFKHYYGI